ncbi:MAG: glycosyltransferase family 2 protein [Candidatus Velthaea sp.]
MRATTVATHVCALAALAYAARTAGFARTWTRVPVVRDVPDAPLVSVVVPARDEERSIAACIDSLLAQSAAAIEVIAVDDRSQDATLAILTGIAARDARLTVVPGDELPEGWVGKPWAAHQGAARARGRWLLFTDADSVHAPWSVTSALAFARARDADAVSIGTLQDLGTLGERAVLPSILGMIFFVLGPFGALNDPARVGKALANGQYLFVSRAAYDALGGHAALRDRIVEDIAFARRLKRDGRFRLIMAAGEDLARVRMYRSFREIWSGFTKNIYYGPEGNVAALAAGVVFLSSISCVPPLLAVDAARQRRWCDALEALACSAATMASAGWAFHCVRLDRRLGWFQPVGTAVMAAITINSAFAVLTGRGVAWRGRTYRGRAGGEIRAGRCAQR